MKKVPDGMPPNEIGAKIRDPFWDARPELQKILQHSEASIAGPWGVLAVVLATVAESIPPSVVLPPMANGKSSFASLNVFFGIVGGSGAGKGLATAEGAGLMNLPPEARELRKNPGGSAEGLVNSLLKQDVEKGTPAEQMMGDWSVRLDMPEIDTLTTLTDRKGALLEPIMRNIWSGEPLGQQNASAETTRRAVEHMYRVTAVVGVQPGRSHRILTTSDGGTLQRFVFLPGNNPDHPDVEPPAPEPLTWTPPYEAVGTGKLTVIPLSPAVKAETTDARRGVIRKDDPGEDGHRNLSRLKIAALFGALNGRRDVNDEDWMLAGRLMTLSDQQIVRMKSAVSQSGRARAIERGAEDAERRASAADETVKKTAQKILAVLERKGRLPFGELRVSLTASLRDECAPAVDLLESEGKVWVLPSGNTKHVELVQGRRLDNVQVPENRENTRISPWTPPSGLDKSESHTDEATPQIVQPGRGRLGQDPLEQADRSDLDNVQASSLRRDSCKACGLPFKAKWGNPFCQCEEEEAG